MQAKKTVILETNISLLTELKGVIEENIDCEVVFTSDDGDEGIKKIIELKPNLVIVGMFLKGTDGCGVINEIKKHDIDSIIIATGVSSDSLMEKAMKEGADYYLIKPFSMHSVVDRIADLLQENKDDSTNSTLTNIKKKLPSIDEKISDIFISIGIPPHIKGYAYLREGIKTTVSEPYIINNVTKVLYPTIAKKFDTSSSKVERAIRHAIEVAWNRGRIDAINSVFGTRAYLGNEKPTNSEFIALVADKLILDNLI